jgi:hypothetical protein
MKQRAFIAGLSGIAAWPLTAMSLRDWYRAYLKATSDHFFLEI